MNEEQVICDRQDLCQVNINTDGGVTKFMIDGIDVASHINAYKIEHEAGCIPVLTIKSINPNIKYDGLCSIEFEEDNAENGETTMNKGLDIIENRIIAHAEICKELNKIYDHKNHDYGDSFHLSYLEEGFAMARIRLSDKVNRFKTLSMGAEQSVNDESIRDTLMDLANYAIMTIIEIERENASNNA